MNKIFFLLLFFLALLPSARAEGETLALSNFARTTIRADVDQLSWNLTVATSTCTLSASQKSDMSNPIFYSLPMIGTSTSQGYYFATSVPALTYYQLLCRYGAQNANSQILKGGLPDLSISEISYSKRLAKVGGNEFTAVDFVVTIINRGLSPVRSSFNILARSAASENYPAGFVANYQTSNQDVILVGRQLVKQVATYLMPKDQSLKADFTFAIDQAYKDGDPTFARAYSEKIDELFETNNTATRTVIILPKSTSTATSTSSIATSTKAANTATSTVVSVAHDVYWDSANLMASGKIQEVVSSFGQQRDILREQSAEAKYLKVYSLLMRNLNAAMQTAIKAFIAYGVDGNTRKLGEGERAAVIVSYQAAFGKLPQNADDLAEAVRIANGSFPRGISTRAEYSAKGRFKMIYKRAPDAANQKDNAAIKVMAYGLRQKAVNRNLTSETAGIKTFKRVFGYAPKTAEDWNAMQAITYSGASR